jgi:Asp-tRNA(Asn)/Glu-tRNA(Gln) amidotransferase A subunit family amidase
MAEGTLTSEALTKACLDRIESRDGQVKAWCYIDPDAALRTARDRDRSRSAGTILGPLHGIPLGVKDVIDTCDMPTTSNSPIYARYQPAIDAECVRIVRAQGAIILGKTDTVEFAAGGRRASTRNPFNLAHTPGGSSSGSAAAVADGQVPLAFGTQTAGSLIRPASYNGLYALKPTHGAVAWPGARQYAPSLDTIGWYGRSVADLALVAQTFRLRGMSLKSNVVLKDLKIGVCRSPTWHLAQPSSHNAFELASGRLAEAGVKVKPLELPPLFDKLPAAQDTIMHAEGLPHFLAEYVENQHLLHQDFRDRVENAKGIAAADLTAAYDISAEGRRIFDALFDADLDAVLTPAALGEAPLGSDAMGAWAMNTMWTLLHVPCLSVPVTKGPGGLPVGVQLVGPRFGEPRLLAIAETLAPIIDVNIS